MQRARASGEPCQAEKRLPSCTRSAVGYRIRPGPITPLQTPALGVRGTGHPTRGDSLGRGCAPRPVALTHRGLVGVRGQIQGGGSAWSTNVRFLLGGLLQALTGLLGKPRVQLLQGEKGGRSLMRWSRILAPVAVLAALFVVVPTALFVGLQWKAVLPFIIYLQLLLIWLQAEISLRQNALFSAQFLPAFIVRPDDADQATLTIENVSVNPAYTLNVTRVLEGSSSPVNPEQSKIEVDRIAALAPREKSRLCQFTDKTALDELRTGRKWIEVVYFDRLGELHTFALRFVGDQLLTVNQEALSPGLLIQAFKSVSLSWKLWRFR